jgi:hypothetical protein
MLETLQRFCSNRNGVVQWALALFAATGCLIIAVVLHEPIPRVHDEFSYALMGNTLAHGRVANPPVATPEFFDTFHVLMQPVYASKYFPAQGLFLALGQVLTGHQAVGIWLSSALACAATSWMLEAWIGPAWALLGGFLMVIQYGIFSYWSQSYWGGMVPALGGALALGAARRLWDAFSWKNSAWLGLAVVILVNSRPLEGILLLVPLSCLLAVRFWRERLWKRERFVLFLIPLATILGVGAFLTCSYNRAITGSPWKPPYVLHEEQYQEGPQFVFLPERPKITYSSPWLQYYYEVYELAMYREPHSPKLLMGIITNKLKSWWAFYCGILLTIPLVFPAFLKDRTRWLQVALLAGIAILFAVSTPTSYFLRGLINLFALAQIVVLWLTFDGFWQRLSIATCALLILVSFLVKLALPHYFAQGACLVLYLQVDGLRRIWEWSPQTNEVRTLSRSERRRREREGKSVHWLVPRLRALVFFLPIVCVFSLVMRVEARLNGWKEDTEGPDRNALLMNDWSLKRADLEHWLEQQPGEHLVFVWYSAHHQIANEWVYNHADLLHSKVVWARNLGVEHNKLLLQQMPERTAWFVDADRRDPQLIPYSEIERIKDQPAPIKTSRMDNR